MEIAKTRKAKAKVNKHLMNLTKNFRELLEKQYLNNIHKEIEDGSKYGKTSSSKDL